MRKSILTVMAVFLLTPHAGGDTIESTPVGPGVIHHHEFREGGPWHLHVLEIDLCSEWIELETVKAGDRITGYARTSSMSSDHDAEGHRVVGAVNGDFYASGGIPIGAQVIGGLPLKMPAGNRSVFGVGLEGEPFFEVIGFQGGLLSADGGSKQIQGINETRDEDELIVYNRFKGSSTGTNYWGVEVTVESLDGGTAINDTFRVTVTAKDSIMDPGHGDNAIPPNGWVLSGHGIAADFLEDRVFVGDTLAIYLGFPPAAMPVAELIGGGPRIIRNGAQSVESVAEGFGASFASDRHPRTAVGFSQDSTTVYFFTVDGRQTGYSLGMSLYELADYMLEWGVWEGINLDGGGSTTMVVRGQVVNSPSDASGERTVANSLLAVSTAPTGPLAVLRIDPDEVYVLVETQMMFSVDGFDQHYNPVAIAMDSLTWGCDAALGSIDGNGVFTAGSDQISGRVWVGQGGVADTAMVYITDIASIELQPDPIILEVGEEQAITPQARDSYQNPIELSAYDYTWSVIGEMGTITSGGLFTAVQPGEGYVTAVYRSAAGSTAVSVGTPTDVIVDDFSDLSGWSLSGTRVTLAECSFTPDSATVLSEPSSGRLHYRLETGGTSALYLNGSVLISGTPDAVGLHVYGDGRGHWLRGEFEDDDEEKFLIDFTTATPGIDWAGSWQYLEVPLEEAVVHWGNPGAELTYPITWTKIYLAETDEAAKDSGTVFLDDFTVSFIATRAPDGPAPATPKDFTLEQNYPNPFNPSTQIRFRLDRPQRVNLRVYNTLGQQVRTLMDGPLEAGLHRVTFQADGLASGIYLCQLQAGGRRETRKMVLLK
jgi:hypothetical protein